MAEGVSGLTLYAGKVQQMAFIQQNYTQRLENITIVGPELVFGRHG